MWIVSKNVQNIYILLSAVDTFGKRSRTCKKSDKMLTSIAVAMYEVRVSQQVLTRQFNQPESGGHHLDNWLRTPHPEMEQGSVGGRY